MTLNPLVNDVWIQPKTPTAQGHKYKQLLLRCDFVLSGKGSLTAPSTLRPGYPQGVLNRYGGGGLREHTEKPFGRTLQTWDITLRDALLIRLQRNPYFYISQLSSPLPERPLTSKGQSQGHSHWLME